MAELTADGSLTLVDLAHQKDPNGNLITIAEVLAEDNEMYTDAPLLEANGTFHHKITRRSSLPTPGIRKLNEGVPVTASHTIPVTEGMMIVEDYSESDKKLVDAAPNPMQFRMNEASAHIEGMSQLVAEKLIYGNANTTPEEISGFATRLNALAATTNVIGAGGSGGDTTSIYIIQWGPRGIHLIYPRASISIGITHEDLGEVTVSSSTSAVASAAQYQAYRDHFVLDVGIAVHDTRAYARLANIEASGTSNIFDEDDLLTLLNRMPRSGDGASIYLNSEVKTQMEIALKDKSNVNYTADSGEGLAGQRVLRFRGNPIRKVDAIVNTETVVS